MQTEGVSFPHVQARLLHERLERLLDRYDPEKVVVCGDFKHNFNQNLKQEWREVQDVLETLAARAKVQLVRGNHDNFLATIAAKKGLELPAVHREEGFTFLHGHEKDAQGKADSVLVMGHEHPGAKLIDSVGATIKLPCYLHGALGRRRVVVLPAFSPLSLHTDVSSARGEAFLSPYLHGAAVGGLAVTAVSEVGLLDFGTIRGLRAASGRL